MRAADLTVVLTGSSSGIGAEAARQLAARGATVCLLARRADELEAVWAEIVAGGGTAHTYPVDLTDPDETSEVVARLLSDHPRIDVLVNNAGRSIRRSVASSVDRAHDYERTMAVNYLGAVRLTLGLLPRFLEQGHGHVVMSSTMSTQVPVPLFSAYLGSKAALESFARSLAAENAHRGITTTVVNFPMVRTRMSGATDIYAAMPMMSARRAGGWLVKASLDRPTRVSSLSGTAAEIGMAAVPGLVTRVVTPGIRRMDKRLARRVRSAD
ncbi:oxidoreductase, short chain dehydrogenase/reductase family protein [Aeromicrobium marinum DSM 15272]|uniref:Oxidoreductase, short chain dehydrogenase/reductase family protein n=1 Tax=Aeromicrobium marinum DSM 15272 TaxID=585531 RepID=E2SBZ9_9ACTN|nr:SDR family NAD(P)-dependent oxidoreductase [Aeromicrobium marinum]EFQ83285.1 oxidoreductase, short chain dehydrogenase/reductase family protein [Aeromicrobium marinum DSM 15272]